MDLPTGIVTFLFTDIEGSTELARSLGDRWRAVIEDHNRILRRTIRDAGGVDVRTVGDAFFAVFVSPLDAVAATAIAQRLLVEHPWPGDGAIRVRMGMHTGEGRLGGDEYFGPDVHRAARIAAGAHGGQVLLSDATRGLVAEALPDGLSLRDLGSHRLKGFDEPQPIFQLVVEGLPSEFPASATMEIPTNLPLESTSFVGRDRELAELRRLMTEHRLVTLTGPGGTGKTRLALRAAHELLGRFRDGVLFVDLSHIVEPSLVPSAVAGAVGVREDPPRPILETLKDHLRHRELLLLLDNFEQVVQGAPMVPELLGAAPSLSTLVTSREPLHVQGEREFGVPPLALPDPSDPASHELPSRFEAVALFVDRAAAVDRGFRLTEQSAAAVAEICVRLDGLPLAIELAASRVRVLSPGSLRERLGRRLPLLTGGPRDAPARQRTLRSTIEWSYELLDEVERGLFRRLAVFAGGWTLASAEAVVGRRGPDLDLLNGLESLIDQSLVVRDAATPEDGRFRMLETIREFGLEQLEDRGEAEPVRRDHASFFLDLAEGAEPELTGAGSTAWLERLEAEHDNLRAALRWAIDSRDSMLGMRLGAALWRYWHFRDHLSEGRGWMARVLDLAGAEVRTSERARSLLAAGSLAYWQNDYRFAGSAYEESLDISRGLDDPRGVADAIYNLAYLHTLEGRYEEARRLYADARERYGELGDEVQVALTLAGVGLAAYMHGDYEEAVAASDEARQTFTRLDHPFGRAQAAEYLGVSLMARGELDEARGLLHEGLVSFAEMGVHFGVATGLDSLAVLGSRLGRHEVAIRLAGAAERLRETIKGGIPPQLAMLEDVREAAATAMAPEEIRGVWEEGRTMSTSAAVMYARENV